MDSTVFYMERGTSIWTETSKYLKVGVNYNIVVRTIGVVDRRKKLRVADIQAKKKLKVGI